MTSIKPLLVLEEHGSDGLELIYNDYEKDFPLLERKSYLRLKELLSNGQYRLIIAKSPCCCKIKAYALVMTLCKYRAVWIDYIAVSKSIRGKGLGSIFLNALKNHFSANADILFAEVEHIDSPEAKERKLQEARVYYYKTNGAIEIKINYELPTINGGFPMYLYYMPIIKGAVADRERVKDSIRSMFKHVHKDIKTTSEIFLRMFGEALD